MTTLTTTLAPATVIAGDLLPAMRQIKQITKATGNYPCIRNMRFQVVDGTLTVSANSFKASGEVSFDVNAADTVAVHVNARTVVSTLTSLIGRLTVATKSAPVSVTVDNRGVNFEFDGVTSTVVSLTSEKDAVADTAIAHRRHLGTLTADAMRSAWKAVKSARGTDDTLPMLTGVNLSVTDDTGLFSTTDRFRACMAEVPFDAGDTFAESPLLRSNGVLLPGEGMVAASAFVGAKGQDDVVIYDVTTEGGAHFIEFHLGNTRLRYAARDVEFPNLAPLFPKTAATAVTFNRAEMIRRLKALGTDGVNGSVLISIEDGQLTLSRSAQGRDTISGTATVPATVTAPESPDSCVCFNATYLRQAVDAINAATVTMTITKPNRPVVFFDGGALDPVEFLRTGSADLPKVSATVLLMPVRLPD